jgi:hypothetical protein
MPDEQKPPTPEAPPAALFDTLIPAEYKDRPYLADLKTLPVGPDGYNAFFKKLDGAQTLLGKKTGVPAADAPAEEWEKFHAAIRPAKAEDYEMPAAKEGVTPDPEVQKAVKGIFHEAGLSKAQAAKLMAKFEGFVDGQTKTQREAAAKADAEFDALTKKTFGPENEKVLTRSKELLNTLTPPEMAPFLNRLPNESLVLVAGLMEAVRAKFMNEDGGMNGGGGDGGGNATDVATLRKQARDLQASPSFRDTFHADHASTKAKVDAIYAQIGKAPK